MELKVENPTPDLQEVIAKAKRYVILKAIMDANKVMYEEMDNLVLDLQKTVGLVSVPVVLTEEECTFVHNGEAKFIAPNQIVTIMDNFAAKNTVFRPAGVKRFDATVETQEEYLAKKEKADKKKTK